MAAKSPIILNSSPQQDFSRDDTITPLSEQYRSVSPSSPLQLPSPSVFRVKRLENVLPEPLRQVGFTTAAKVWKDRACEQSHNRPLWIEGNRDSAANKVGDVVSEPARSKRGKLASLKKLEVMNVGKSNKDVSAACASTASTCSTSQKAADHDSPVTHRTSAGLLSNSASPLSVYEFLPEESLSPITVLQTASDDILPADPCNPNGEESVVRSKAPVRKSRKRLFKSESIILNSDELVQSQAVTAASKHVSDYGSKNDILPRKGFSTSAAALTGEFDATAAQREKNAGSGCIDRNGPVLEEANGTSAYFRDNATLPHVSRAAAGRNVNQDTVDRSILACSVIDGRAQVTSAPEQNGQDEAQSKDVPAAISDHVSSSPENATRSLSDVLGRLAYGDVVELPRSVQSRTDCHAPTKRRRIDLADASTVGHAARTIDKQVEAKASGLAKPPKKQKKQARTITALATKAYERPAEPAVEQPIVSDFFTIHENEQAPAMEAAAASTSTSCVKPKKARKPRVKKADVQSDGQCITTAKVKKTTKTKKTKVKFKEDEFCAKLLSPQNARLKEKTQGFLFGTSSQLAAEEPPEFIRDMQAALRDSEAVADPQQAPVRTNHLGVLASPYQTSVSIGKAHRGLWSTSARDDDGLLTVPDGGSPCKTLENHTILPIAELPAESVCDMEGSIAACPVAEIAGNEDDESANQLRTSQREKSIDPAEKYEVIDLCPTSPDANHDTKDTAISPTLPGFAASVMDEGVCRPTSDESRDSEIASAQLQHEPTNCHEISTLCESDDTSIELPSVKDSRTTATEQLSMLPVPTLPSLVYRATSPFHLRAPLQSLDANVMPMSLTSPLKPSNFAQTCAFSHSAQQGVRTPATELERPRGRPQSSTDAGAKAEAAEDIATKKRGRPRKQVITEPVEGTPRKRGRPKKNLSSASRQSPGRAESSSKVSLTRRDPDLEPEEAESSWLRIDEISDSDAPVTPSPPRRRATSSPPAVPPLALGPNASASPLTVKAPAVVANNVKATDSQWPSISASLFPDITRVIRSTPPSTAWNEPTWHEKMLMYDPIVLEDLCAWLNAKGLRYQVTRPKPKTKVKKSRNGKKAGTNSDTQKEVEAEQEQGEYEVREEEVKPWMVQKWCEEKSVCCLWKEGLRGGVKTRY